MEKVKKRRCFSGLRQAFILYVLMTFALVALLSGGVIWGCVSLQNYLLPDSHQVFLTVQTTYADGSEKTVTQRMSLDDILEEIPQMVSMLDNEESSSAQEQDVRYSVASIENSFSALSARRKLVYRASQISMVALPVLFSVVGILFCGLLFYRRRLKTPLTLLSSAAEQISRQNLDFYISYDREDEMGKLCASFEQMRMTLKENNQKLWHMLEERKKLQRSVAHDLRNPIAILLGYAEYLQINLSGGTIHSEKILAIVDNMSQTARRMERYTDSLRTISGLEELEIQPQTVDFSTLSANMRADLTLLTEEKNLTLDWEDAVSQQELTLDAKILYRILENLVGNATRFAAKEIKVSFSCDKGLLTVTVTDDGIGFPQKVLDAREDYVCMDETGGHTGMGLSICRILCRKHGGDLILFNSDRGGAAAKFILSV